MKHEMKTQNGFLEYRPGVWLNLARIETVFDLDGNQTEVRLAGGRTVVLPHPIGEFFEAL